MHARGFWLNSWEDPAQVPILRYDGFLIWLLDDGLISFMSPAEYDE